MSRSKMDPGQITQSAYDEQMEAHRVYMLPTEMEFDTHNMQVHDAKAGDIIDTSEAMRINIIAVEPVEIKMIILEQEISLGNISGIKEICSPAIKAMADCLIVVQG